MKNNKGIFKRKRAATAINEYSSRSHSILTIYLQIKDKNLIKKIQALFR